MRILHSAAGIREAPAARAASPGTDYATTSTEKEVVIKDKKLKQHQTIELGGYRGASNSSTMAEMTVEEITMKANKVTDEADSSVSALGGKVCLRTHVLTGFVAVRLGVTG
ncbi:hypothetical protein AGIG_G6181 [Arapaima gigas]